MIFIHNNLPPTLALAVGMATSSSAPLIISAAANFETTSAMWLRSMRPTCCIPGDSVLVALALDMRRRRRHTRVQDNHQSDEAGRTVYRHPSSCCHSPPRSPPSPRERVSSHAARWPKQHPWAWDLQATQMPHARTREARTCRRRVGVAARQRARQSGVRL